MRAYRSPAVRLALLAFVIYNANLRSVTSADTFPTRYLPISIITEFNLDLDEFPFLLDYPGTRPGDDSGLPYYLQYSHGHYMSNYPVMPAILATPVYVVPVLLGLTDGSVSAIGYSQTEIMGTLLSKIAASLALAISVAIIYLTLLRVTTRSAAIWIALLYAFATSSWSLTAQGLWQNSMSQPLLALALYLLIRAREEPRMAALAGVPLALAVASRPPTMILAATYAAYVFFFHRKQFLRFLLFPFVIGILLWVYNLYYFGTLTGGYSSLGTDELFVYPRLTNALGLLVSPSRGLLIYSPFLIFALVGLGKALLRRSDPLLTYTAVGTILFVFFYSTWSNWPGAFSYSYRHLVDLLPGLSLLLTSVFGWLTSAALRTIVFAVLAGYSVVIQVIGSFFYPCGWLETPAPAYQDRGRFWDWSDPEFLRCLKSGPVVPDGLKFLRSMAQGS